MSCSRRLALFALATWLLGCSAIAQTETLQPGTKLSPLQRSNEALRRLDLPPDAKLETQSREAHAKVNACKSRYFAANARDSNADAQSLAAAGCAACDREI